MCNYDLIGVSTLVYQLSAFRANTERRLHIKLRWKKVSINMCHFTNYYITQCRFWQQYPITVARERVVEEFRLVLR